MTRLEALKELAAKVEAGECPMWTAITGGIGLNPDNRHLSFYDAYHGSLDAAKALHEAVLPGWGYRVSPQYALVQSPKTFYGALDMSKDAINTDNPARAWLLAILKALIAMEEGQ